MAPSEPEQWHDGMQAEELKDLVVNALDDQKAKEISVLDVRGIASFTDFMVIASGTSRRHVASLAEHVVGRAREAGVRAMGIEGGDIAEWVLVDLGDVVAHVMQPTTRGFYNLEKLWSVEADTGEDLKTGG